MKANDLIANKATAEFSRDLLPKLPTSSDAPAVVILLADLNHHIRAVDDLQQRSITLSSKLTAELKHWSCELWNGCIRERRKLESNVAPNSRGTLLAKVRVFSFQLMALGRNNGNNRQKGGSEDEIIYMIEKALAVGKLCMEEGDLDGAKLGLHKLAEYLEHLKAIPPGELIANRGVRTAVESQYLSMRTALVRWCHRDRLLLTFLGMERGPS